MNLKKNVFSYLMWFVYSLAVCISLLGISGTLSTRAGYSRTVGFGICLLWLLLVCFVVFLMHKLMAGQAALRGNLKMPALVAESMTAVLLFAAGIFFRVSSLPGAGESAAYLEMALVAEGHVIPQVVHGSVYLYLQLLHFVCVVFGNKLMAGIWLQVVLQMLAGVFLYLAVRRLSGPVAALTMTAFLMAGPMMVKDALLLSPKMLFLLIYAFVMFLCALCVSGGKHPVFCFISGIAVSVVCYLDIMGITLLSLLFGGILMKRREEESLPRRIGAAALCLLGCCAGFAAVIVSDAFASAKGIANVLGAWGSLYQPVAFGLPTAANATASTADVLILLLLMSVGVFSYWCSHREERQSVWILSALSLIALQCYGMTTGEMEGFSLLYVLFAALAGVGLSSIFLKTETGAEKELSSDFVVEDLETAEGETVLETGEITPTETAEPEDVKATAEPEKEKITELVEPEETEKTQETAEPEKMLEIPAPEEEGAKRREVKMLDNPLPLPRKHVKKVLDYDRLPAKGQDDFDLIVDENDDFDI